MLIATVYLSLVTVVFSVLGTIGLTFLPVHVVLPGVSVGSVISGAPLWLNRS